MYVGVRCGDGWLSVWGGCHLPVYGVAEHTRFSAFNYHCPHHLTSGAFQGGYIDKFTVSRKALKGGRRALYLYAKCSLYRENTGQVVHWLNTEQVVHWLGLNNCPVIKMLVHLKCLWRHTVCSILCCVAKSETWESSVHNT